MSEYNAAHLNSYLHAEFGLMWLLMSLVHDDCTWTRQRLAACAAALPRRG